MEKYHRDILSKGVLGEFPLTRCKMSYILRILQIAKGDFRKKVIQSEIQIKYILKYICHTNRHTNIKGKNTFCNTVIQKVIRKEYIL